MRRVFGLALAPALLACAAEPPGAERVAGALSAASVLVNECSTGSSGWLELLNRGPAPVDLAGDAASCWYVDDTNGGGSPRLITDANVNHPAGSSMCDAAGRPATCGLVGPGEHVWVKFQYVNSVTPDECRLLSAPRGAGGCGTPADTSAGGPTSSAAAGQCFGRPADGADWAPAAIACTQGAPNPETPAGVDAGVDAPADAGDAARAADAADAGAPASGPPVILRLGRPDRLLLAGTVVTPDVAFEGEVLIDGDTLACVAPSCAGEPAAADASMVQTNGIIFPGLIDTHNHILFDIFDETDWSPAKVYTNHNQWPNEPRYKAMVDAKQYLNGEAGSPVSIGCEMDKYGELKALIAGTTSVVGSANPTNRECYGSLARTIDQTPNDLGADRIQAATIFPTTSTADGVCRNFGDGDTAAYVVHVAEGVDASALGELGKLFSVTTTDGCLLAPQTTIVHGTALGDAELGVLAAAGMSLVWSPRSNIFLYGGGTDLTKTANVPLALQKGINVALAPDWSIGGSQNLLDELRFADGVDNAVWGDVLSPRALVQMVTANAARALGLGATLGTLAPGFKADVAVVGGGDRARPYDALLAATPAAVRLVLVGGVPLYGDAVLSPLGPASPGCEPLDACGASKFVCVAEAAGTTTSKLGQTLADITATIATELQRYDDLDLSPWDFSPITPLVRCAP
jgi:cytosine/adenosine deaminase-related metal-dependent hydrolase